MHNKCQKYFSFANEIIPGGVNSPVRSFKNVDNNPIAIKRGQGAKIYDLDDKEYIDYVLGFGPLALGHCHPQVVSCIKKQSELGFSFGATGDLELQLAKVIVDAIDSIDMIRFVNSGTEATMSALRLARAYTKKDKIIKFSGCYHGHCDHLLVQAGSGVASLSIADSAGIPTNFTKDTLVANYNDIEGVKQLFIQFKDQIAGVIIEPVMGNMGLIKPQDDFLIKLQNICHDNDALLIADEVMTGFRAALKGAQHIYGIKPDISCFGKIIGGGLPVGAFAGAKEIMSLVAPLGPVYQAGTLSGNSLTMCAGLSTLDILMKTDAFAKSCKLTTILVDNMKNIASRFNIDFSADYIGSMFGFAFLKSKEQIVDYHSALNNIDITRFKRFFHFAITNGLYFAPSPFEAGFLSSAHTVDDIDKTIEIFTEFCKAESSV